MGGRESAEEGEYTRRIYSFLRLRLQLPTNGTVPDLTSTISSLTLTNLLPLGAAALHLDFSSCHLNMRSCSKSLPLAKFVVVDLFHFI